MIKEGIFEENKKLFRNAYNRHNMVVVKKARNCGMTTILLDHYVNNPTTNFLHIIPAGKEIGELRKRYKGLTKLKNVSFASSARYEYIVSKGDFDVLVMEECAFMDNSIWEMFNVIFKNKFKKIILVSTPNEPKGFFYDAYINVANRSISLKTLYDIEDINVYEKLCEVYNYDLKLIQNYIFGRYHIENQNNYKSTILNNVSIETLLYYLMVERIRRIEEESAYSVTFSISDYIRELIKADVKYNLLKLDD